ncbi:low choriolytic enzyme-like [Portunus trituberculatus]|uniref:Metalloendopeptidase n=1 Tax=Portunus trituberculatus TaxID=210409 RepID=A0A5B7IUF9_PORTR|nr:low choriolytic enzyme-like [Portunus trituberculatus]MPC89181.1 Low choriolytic enzyme [Portunus trituberculatus]
MPISHEFKVIGSGMHWWGQVNLVLVTITTLQGNAKMTITTTTAAEMFRALRWPNATVPVEVSEGVLTSSNVHDLYAAMHHLNNLTCLRFVNATQHQYRVLVVSSTGCGSLVGYVGVGEYQKLFLGASCFLKRGIVLHELLHVAGLFHEHTRPDRDQYVRVVWTNIHKDKHKNFAVPPWMKSSPGLVTFGLPYDFGSLLHYGLKVFTMDQERPSMVLQRPHEYTGLVGQRDAPSRTDVARVNRLYECWNHYLGDDLPGAKTYLVWHAATLNLEVSHSHTSDKEI